MDILDRYKWNKENLHKLCCRNNAIFIEDCVSFTRDTRYNFICSCGNKYSKTGRRIKSTGALCKKCTQKVGDTKGKKSREIKLTNEQRNDKLVSNEIINNKKENEKKLCEWRDNLIKDIIPNPNIWYTHPEFENYEANTNGNIRNKQRRSVIQGSTNNDGRTTISIYKHKKQKHRFIMECLYGIEIPLDYDIDHIDQNPGNNNFKNLKILTRKEHCVKTANTNPEKGKKASINSSKRIICQKLNEEGKCIEEIYFNSMNDVSRALHIDRKTIRQSIQTNKPTKLMYLFLEINYDNKDIEGEKWLEYTDTKLYVSNMGRIWFKYLSVPYKTYGSKSIDGYYSIHHKGKTIQVHNLVASLFIGKKPTIEHTIDHIDNDRGNNIVKNLRWANKSEQALNRTNIKLIEVYNYLTGEIIDTFEASKFCCEKYNVHPSIISNALGFGIDHFNRGRQLGKHKYLSVRYKDLTNEKKLNREIDILEHDLVVLMKDKNKRKNNNEKLPVHITKRSPTSYTLKITFRGETFSKSSTNINILLSDKETWINKIKEHYINLYRKIYC